MLSIEYVTKYQVGDKVEIPVAEELLANYNDFYAANLEFYQGHIKKTDGIENESVIESEPTAEMAPEEIAQVEKKVGDDVKAFAATWGSMDFASATLVGLAIDWDRLQDQLLVEQEKKIRPADSALAPVGQKLRKVASVLSFSERIVTRLRGKAVDKQMVDLIIKGFTVLLQQVYERDLDFPEMNGAENKKIMKLKTVDGIIDYANKLFAIGR